MVDQVAYVPLSEYFPTEAWPIDLFSPADITFLQDIAYVEGTIGADEDEGVLHAEVVLRVMREVVLDLPAGFAVVLGHGNLSATLDTSPDGWRARLATEVLKLRLPPSLFRPVLDLDGQLIADPDPTHAVDIAIPFAVAIDHEGNLDVEWPGEGQWLLDLPRCMVSDSGIIIEARDVGLRLSTYQNLPQGAAEIGLDDEWRGLFFAEATVHLPEALGGAVPDDVRFTDCYIGSGGFTGTASADWVPAFGGSIFGMQFALARFGVTFVQNALTRSDIAGRIALPFFDTPLDVTVGLELGGGLTVAVSGADSTALTTLEKPGILRLALEGIGFKIEQGLLTVILSGNLTPLVGGVNWPTFSVQELAIDSNGNVRLDGGWLDLPNQMSFDFYGFRMELTKIGFGTDEDGTRWIGFSGGVRLVEDLPLGGSVEGLKIKWKGNSVDLELRGMGVELTVPDALYLKGKVEFFDDGPLQGFKGGITLKVIPTNVTVDAQLLVGKNSQNPAYTFAYVFVAGELPAGIPIFNTGLSIYGLAGLVGYNVEPAKAEDASWFDGWYLRPPTGVSDVSKWRDQRNAFALGAGLTLGTASDNGYAFNGKFLLVLVLPGPLILLDGKAGFLQERGKEPQLVSLAVFDGRAGTLLFNVQARFLYKESGELIDVTGFAEAFFDFGNPRNWHLYLGMDTPSEKRIRATFIKLFEANSYLMLQHSGARMGAWFGYDGKWKAGPLGVTLEAWVEGAAAVSWAPKQFEGNLTLHGNVALRAFGFSAGLGLQSLVEARTPHPYYVHAELEVKLNLPWPLPDPKASIELTWEEEIPPPTPKPLEVLGLEHLKVSEKWLTASDLASAPVVPLDARPVICFQRNVWDHTGLAANALPPTAERVGSFLFRYHLDAVRLEKRTPGGGGWVDVTVPPSPSLPAGKLWGMWQAVPAAIGDGSPQGLPPMTKLMLWSRTPFDYGRETGGTASEDGFIDSNPDWPCNYDWTPVQECGDFEGRSPGPMPVFSNLEDLAIVAFQASIVEWSDDWIPVSRAVSIGIKQQPDTTETSEVAETHLTHLHAAAPIAPARQGMFRIFFPPNTAAAYLYVGRGTNGFVHQPGKDKQELTYIKEPILVLADPGNLAYVDLTGTVILLRICWVERTEWDRRQFGLAAVDKLAADATAALTTEPEVFEPHKEYRLTVETRVERSGNGGQSWDTVGTFSDVGYFRTHSAPGLEDAATGGELVPNEATEHYPARGPLQDLTPYVHQTVPEHGSRPVYRAYDIGVDFNEAYTEAMYLLEGKPLVLQVQDANGQPVLDTSGNALTTLNQWEPLEAAELAKTARRAEVTWAGLLEFTGCGGDIGGTELPPPQGLWIRHPRLLLAAQAVHRAIVGSAVPAAAVPLAADGTIRKDLAGAPIVFPLTGPLSDQLDVINTAGVGQKLLIAGNAVVETSLGATGGAKAFDGNKSNQLALLKQALAQAQAPAPSVRRVYDWSFTTSRFATFVHHAQSFRDRVRDHHQESGAPAETLFSVEELTWLKELLAARATGVPPNPTKEERDEEAQAFEKVMSFLGLETRSLPEVLEVTILRDAGRSYGLLIENPEPLPFRRVTLALEKNVRSIESILAPDAPAKLIAAGFAASDAAGDLVQEYLDFLLLHPMKLDGMKLQVEGNGGAWQDHFAFGPTDTLPEGTVMRVHTGASAADPNPAPEMDHYYAQDTGGSPQRKFGASSVRARLVRQDGQTVHERLFQSSGFANAKFRILRSRDDTRALIFVKTATEAVGDVPSGTVRFTWNFSRNVPPMLRRMGSDRSEVTSIEFSRT